MDRSLENGIYPVNDDCPLIHENEIFLEFHLLAIRELIRKTSNIILLK